MDTHYDIDSRIDELRHRMLCQDGWDGYRGLVYVRHSQHYREPGRRLLREREGQELAVRMQRQRMRQSSNQKYCVMKNELQSNFQHCRYAYISEIVPELREVSLRESSLKRILSLRTQRH